LGWSKDRLYAPGVAGVILDRLVADSVVINRSHGAARVEVAHQQVPHALDLHLRSNHIRSYQIYAAFFKNIIIVIIILFVQ